ncbi:dCTP deaminase [Candidatus Wolfebacteria bacterium]|nr:dCTP deaminase [Candidatus Wolfebacteria bacterium]
MILSDTDIRAAIESGKIKITPKPNFRKQLGSCSLDLRLSNIFKVFTYNRSTFIDVANPKTYGDITKQYVVKKTEPFVLHPNEFVLGATIEKISLPQDIAARIDGRSSLGRLGLIIQTAGHIDPGFNSNITLEIANIGRLPIILWYGLRVCQLVFEPLSSPTTKPYKNKIGAAWNKAGALKRVSLM